MLFRSIAELSKKLETGKEDTIPEESEAEQEDKSNGTDSCVDEDGEEEEDEVNGLYDENSLAFERDLDKVSYDQEVLLKIELFDELQKEVSEAKNHNDQLQVIIANRDRELVESSEAIRQEIYSLFKAILG